MAGPAGTDRAVADSSYVSVGGFSSPRDEGSADEVNEDYCLVKTYENRISVIAVADGVSESKESRVASRAVIGWLDNTLKRARSPDEGIFSWLFESMRACIWEATKMAGFTPVGVQPENQPPLPPEAATLIQKIAASRSQEVSKTVAPTESGRSAAVLESAQPATTFSAVIDCGSYFFLFNLSDSVIYLGEFSNGETSGMKITSFTPADKEVAPPQISSRSKHGELQLKIVKQKPSTCYIWICGSDGIGGLKKGGKAEPSKVLEFIREVYTLCHQWQILSEKGKERLLRFIAGELVFNTIRLSDDATMTIMVKQTRPEP
ncbi:MAG: protein phosphatase 2C domain-containing protein [Verrucomicrobia bacterium]|nr:protein phosphatase 2C domain-containing protein [Verrucomicrobiota bacterium]